jgi:hypothetical protein
VTSLYRLWQRQGQQDAPLRRLADHREGVHLGPARVAPARFEKRRSGKESPMMSVSYVTRAGVLVWWSVLCCITYGYRPAAAQPLSDGSGDLRVMTYNVDEGTDFLEVAAARTVAELLVAVGQTITQVRATQPPQRMAALATQILAAHPALISLQELDQWSTGPFDPVTGTCGALAVEFDLLHALLEALAAQGGHYQVAVQVQQFAFPPTPGLLLPDTFLCVAVVNDNAILVRTDLPASTLQWSNPQAAQFVSGVVLSTPLGPIPVPSAWVAVDAVWHGTAFRFIGTHLQADAGTVRDQQGAELRAGVAHTALPVIVAMDANAPAWPPPLDTTYLDFLAAGYRDAWLALFPAAPGFTCCQAPLVNNVVSALAQRSDLILTRGPVAGQNMALFGADAASKTADGLWPSDHAGVAAQVVIEEE